MPRSWSLAAAACLASAAVLASAVIGSGCGGSGSGHASASSGSSSRNPKATPGPAVSRRHRADPTLHAVRQLALPAARAGGATAALHGRVVYAGGLSSADVSTATVFELDLAGRVSTAPSLPSAIHDAAAAALGSRLLVFGGGISEGSNRIVQLQPGPPRLVGTLPQALSDLVATEIGGVAYVAGGWNGTSTNREIYAVSSQARVRAAGRLPLGVRYPAAAALGGRLLIAGGEMTSGDPTDSAWSFDPASGRLARLPRLPAPTDHAGGISFAGRFYVIGGLRSGVLTPLILSWAPGERHWRGAGRLPAPLADVSAEPAAGEVAVLGGRGATGRVAGITLLRGR